VPSPPSMVVVVRAAFFTRLTVVAVEEDPPPHAANNADDIEITRPTWANRRTSTWFINISSKRCAESTRANDS
jgi:hypothetical protein